MKFELYKIFKKKTVLILIGISLLWSGFCILYRVLQYTTYTEQMERLTKIKAIHYNRVHGYFETRKFQIEMQHQQLGIHNKHLSIQKTGAHGLLESKSKVFSEITA